MARSFPHLRQEYLGADLTLSNKYANLNALKIDQDAKELHRMNKKDERYLQFYKTGDFREPR